MIDDLWPEPHDLRFDLVGTAAGAGWIDDAARAARATLAATACGDVVGHLDWRVQNLAFAGSRVCAIYDWDSLALVPEAALVGSASVIHPVDWRLEQPDPLPTLDQVDGFVADYEAARGAPFEADEHEVLAAGQRWVASYGARCQHSDDLLGVFPDVDHSRGWPRSSLTSWVGSERTQPAATTRRSGASAGGICPRPRSAPPRPVSSSLAGRSRSRSCLRGGGRRSRCLGRSRWWRGCRASGAVRAPTGRTGGPPTATGSTRCRRPG